MIHFWIRPVSKKIVFAGCIFLLAFMYIYGFYKNVGVDSWEALQSTDARAALVQQTGRSFEVVLLHDLARSDVQAFLLYRLATPDSDYAYAWGRTYLAAPSFLIPTSVWSERPPSKVKEGTEVQYGMGSYLPGSWSSSRIYGLGGEAMLNFGPAVVPLMFGILGFAVAQVKQLLARLQPSDSRLILLPFVVSLCCIALVNDLDNVLVFVIKNGAIPIIVLMLSSTRVVRTT
jgi:hypothetical protein